MNTYLADVNLLVALVVTTHVHHRPAITWFDRSDANLAVCPITEGTLLRFLLREGISAADAMTTLDALRAQPWHRFWPDAIPYVADQLVGVIGHRQVTDAYLVALARHSGGKVVTFDKGLAALHPHDTLLLETGAASR